jgi:putative ABC transport system permease protein
MSGFIGALPGAIAQGIIWGVMAIGVFITFRVLDIADLTVDGTMSTGGAVMVLCMTNGLNVWPSMLIAFLAGCIAGFATGVFHTKFGIPAILAGILTQLSLYSINLRILGGKANQPLSSRNYKLVFSLGSIPQSLIFGAIFVVALIANLYWFFCTELGQGNRDTGSN